MEAHHGGDAGQPEQEAERPNLQWQEVECKAELERSYEFSKPGSSDTLPPSKATLYKPPQIPPTSWD